MISCTMAWYETNLGFMQDILMLKIVFESIVENSGKEFSKATVYTNSSVVRRILFASRFKYGCYNAFAPISEENTSSKDEIKGFTN